MKNLKVVLFTSSGSFGSATLSYLKENYTVVGVVLDIPKKGSGLRLIKRRIKRLGVIKVFLQLLFMKGIVPLLRLESKKRQSEILSGLNLNSLNEFKNILRADTINDPNVIDFVNELKPDVVMVNGTGIIHKKIINGIEPPLLNMHAGITPKYRGVHGGYWALANKDLDNCGVTVHFIDAGIDTGGIISQKNIEIEKRDNYITYPLLQLLKGFECMDEAFNQINNGKLTPIKNGLESKLYYHPTIIDYFHNRIFNKVK